MTSVKATCKGTRITVYNKIKTIIKSNQCANRCVGRIGIPQHAPKKPCLPLFINSSKIASSISKDRLCIDAYKIKIVSIIIVYGVWVVVIHSLVCHCTLHDTVFTHYRIVCVCVSVEANHIVIMSHNKTNIHTQHIKKKTTLILKIYIFFCVCFFTFV